MLTLESLCLPTCPHGDAVCRAALSLSMAYGQAEKLRIEREAQEKAWKEEKDARSYDKLYDEAKCTRAGEMELDSDGEPDFM